jgi:alkylhydroperoxidase family enzyme
MSAASSSKAAQPIRIEAPDATYKSLASLLASCASSASSHLELIPVNGLSSSITHYLSTLPTNDAAQFAKLLASSNALWSQSSILQRSTMLFEATARSVIARINVIVGERKGSLGWSSRRNLVSWIRAIADAIHLDTESIPSSCGSVAISTLAILTGLVAGLQAAKAQKSQNENRGLNVHYALDRGEDEWCIALAECLAALSSQELPLNEWEAEFKKATTHQSSQPSGAKTATLYLAAQVAPFISSKKIEALPTDSLLNTLAATMLELFEDSRLLDSIREDVSQDDRGLLILKSDSPTAKRASSFASHPLFPLMGPLSRMVSLALSSATRTMSHLQLQDLLMGEGSFIHRMEILSLQWQSKWLSCRLAGASEEEIDQASRTQTTRLWNIFKTLLFSYTMIFDALMEAIVDVCPSPTITLPADKEASSSGRWPPSTTCNIPRTYLHLTTSILKVYSHLSWITATFGSSAFDAYRRVFHEALEVLARDAQDCVNLVDHLAPQGPTLQINAGRRAAVTYYLDVVEQSMGILPDEMVVQDILPLVKDYLEHAEFRDSFESAHSVILSIFASQKAIVAELTAYYIDLLLASYPRHLKEEQLTHAYSTVINATSDKSDTVTWYSLEMLWKAIDEERLSSSIESASRRRQLSYVYIAQLPNVNLVLLRSMLFKVKQLVLQEEEGSEERIAVCERVFSSLAGLDSSTREEGLKWWLDERKIFGV